MQLSDQSLLATKAYIGGEWVGETGAKFSVINPASEKVIAEVPDQGAVDTEKAVAAAEAAGKAWAGKTAKARADILKRWFELILEAKEDLAQILTAEMGKPIAESRGEVAYGASFIEWFAEEGKRAYGDVIPSPLPDRRLMTIKQPIGVVAAITPWNFPNAMITRKVAPALAAGCTVVVKPAEDTPLSALALAVLAERAGIPAGVFNVVTGQDAAEIGGVLTSDKRVRKVTFTGSTEVGRLLMRQSAETIKKVALELGGNAPFIVFDDADVDAAVAGAIACKFRNSGQTCVCANRLYVQAGVYDEFVTKFSTAVKALKVGEGVEDGVEQGPLINIEALQKVEGLIEDATTKGATVTTGGARHALGGTFFQPTVLSGVTADMSVSAEETFGPVAPVFKFEHDDDVIELANATDYGLASYFYARDIGRIFKVAEALDYGMVGVNTGILSTEVAPFGGIKQSGIGREGGKEGLDDFLEVKYIALAGL